MNRVLLLTKAFLKTGYGTKGTLNKRKGRGWEYVNIIAIIIAFLVFASSIGALLFQIYDMLDSVKQTGLMVGLAYNLYAFMVFIFGIMSIITVFYFAKDIEYVLPLPFKPYEISLAKFVTVVVYEYIVGAFIMIPVTVAYGYKSGAGIIFYIVSLFCYLLIPILPLVYSSVISIILMRFTNISKHKDGFRIFAGLIGMVIALGLNIFINSATQKSFQNPEALQKLVAQGDNSLINTISNLFITSKLGAFAATSTNSINIFINVALILVVSIAAILIFIIISNSFYLKGALGAFESFSKQKKLSKESVDKSTKQKSKLVAWVGKEIIVLFRTPSYLLNCVAIVIIVPIILVISLLTEGNVTTMISSIRSLFSSNEIYPIILIGAFGAVLFMSVMNPTAATSISREGDQIYLSKYLPVSYKTQINAKIISSALLNSITVLMVIGALIYLKASIYIILAIIILSIGIIYFVGASGVLIDLLSPKLIWDNEQKAVKQNFNSLKAMLVGVIFAAITIIPIIYFELNFIISFLILFVITSIVNLILLRLVNTLGIKLFKKLAD